MKNKYNFVSDMSLRQCLTILFLIMVTTLAHAHDSDVDFMQSTGKIYVVVGVVLIMFLGIVLFLWYLQRKLSKLEKQIDHERSE